MYVTLKIHLEDMTNKEYKNYIFGCLLKVTELTAFKIHIIEILTIILKKIFIQISLCMHVGHAFTNDYLNISQC